VRKNRTIDRTSPKRPPIVIVLLQAVVVFVLLLAGMGCTDATVELGEAVYPPDRVRTECAPGTAGGLAGIRSNAGRFGRDAWLFDRIKKFSTVFCI